MEKSEILTIIADNVRGIMNEQGMSVTELARRCKISLGSVSKIINGNMSITIPMAITLAAGLNVPLEDITKGLESSTGTPKSNTRTTTSPTEQISIAIVSINNRRLTCVRNAAGEIIGTSELEGSLDLVETSSALLQGINESIHTALPKHRLDSEEIKQARLNLVTQSYEFEDTRYRFKNFAKRHFKDVSILSDWQITYLSIFDNKPGISLIVDKGVSLCYMLNGEIKKLGGWKFPVYDLGGENWLGAETIRHTIEATEGYIPMTELAHSILAKFGGSIDKITETCFKGARDADIFCLFAEPLLRAYLTGDTAAKEIVLCGFTHLERSIKKADSLMGHIEKIAVNGSLKDIYTPLIDKSRLAISTTDAQKAELLAKITDAYLVEKGLKII